VGLISKDIDNSNERQEATDVTSTPESSMQISS